MRKETIADKLAKKAFNSPGFQNSWNGHMQAFGPILEPAFVDDYQAKIHLTAALNHISRGELKQGIVKMEKVKDYLETDADKAAWLFFMGVVYEMGGAKDRMLDCYQQAAQFGHRFYLPYLKVAKHAYEDAAYDASESYYCMAIQCLEESEQNDLNKKILVSAYTNYASCLIVMHRLDEAAQALDAAEKLQPGQVGTNAVSAILCAVRGEREKAEELLSVIEAQSSELAASIRIQVDNILNGTHPHYFRIELKDGSASSFWHWFMENQTRMVEMIGKQDFEGVFQMMLPEVKKLFPFLEREPQIGIMPVEDGIEITFADFYMVSMEAGYAELLAARPAEVAGKWRFSVAH